MQTLYHIIPVDRISNPKPGNLFLMGRPDLLHTFTKIALWRQTQYSKIVYLDADMVVLQNLDHLFQLDVPFAAAPDIGWPDAFNSGFMMLCMVTYGFIWQAGNKRSQKREAERVERLRAGGWLRGEKGGVRDGE